LVAVVAKDAATSSTNSNSSSRNHKINYRVAAFFRQNLGYFERNIDGTIKSVLGGEMKTQIIGLTLALSFVAGATCFAADDPQIGTWKLNEAKSKLTRDAGKNTTVVYEAAGDQVKVVIDGTDKDGKPTHNEWTGKFDGKDYAVTGDPKSDMRTYKKIDDHTLAFTVKKDGKTTATGRIVVAADGKSRMVTSKGADEEGKKSKDKAAYDKQ
jgi:hypothetical protein